MGSETNLEITGNEMLVVYGTSSQRVMEINQWWSPAKKCQLKTRFGMSHVYFKDCYGEIRNINTLVCSTVLEYVGEMKEIGEMST